MSDAVEWVMRGRVNPISASLPQDARLEMGSVVNPLCNIPRSGKQPELQGRRDLKAEAGSCTPAPLRALF